MTESWEIYETEISKLKSKISAKQQEIYILNSKLNKVEAHYRIYQEQTNGNEPLEE